MIFIKPEQSSNNEIIIGTESIETSLDEALIGNETNPSSITVVVAPETGRNFGFSDSPNSTWYFKVYKGIGYNKNGECARISILKNEYIIHDNSIFLDAAQRKALVKFFNKKEHLYWIKTIEAIAEEFKPNGYPIEKLGIPPIPDYTKIEIPKR